MSTVFTNATLVLPDRLLENGWLLVCGGKIQRFGTGEAPAAEESFDCSGKYLSPGFIDVHVHGGGGGSFMSTDLNGHITAMKMHLDHGVTAMTPTPGTADVETIKALAEIKAQIDQLSKQQADAGIAASASLSGDDILVNIEVKSAVKNDYRVAAWILEDDIKAQQSSNGALEEWMHTHENALRAFSGTSLNLGIYGEKLGTLKAGETAEKVLTIEFKKDWKAENCKVFILVNSSKDGKFDVANCTICPIGGNVAYQYN